MRACRLVLSCARACVAVMDALLYVRCLLPLLRVGVAGFGLHWKECFSGRARGRPNGVADAESRHP